VVEKNPSAEFFEVDKAYLYRIDGRGQSLSLVSLVSQSVGRSVSQSSQSDQSVGRSVSQSGQSGQSVGRLVWGLG